MRAKLTYRKNAGVAVVFFALTFGIMMSFMLLVMNTGTLVYQKMKLQSAVDLAAYAGASVQATYLSGPTKEENSIREINGKILKRYTDMLEDMRKGPYPGPMVFGLPDPVSCIAACTASTALNAQHIIDIYKDGVRDIGKLQDEARKVLASLPEASRKAAERTIALNIPELNLKEEVGGMETVNNLNKVLNPDDSSLGEVELKNAVLSFSSKQGIYLANVVAPVPHSFPFLGPVCADANADKNVAARAFYCIVNGAGILGGTKGFRSAMLAYASGQNGTGNVGTLDKISNPEANAISLHFVENPHKPDPFFMTAAEWYPPGGTSLNLEQKIAGASDLYPDHVRLVSVAAAEPFGSNLTSATPKFGVRLQSIRKLLLDPRIQGVRGDYKDAFDYMQFLGPRDRDGNSVETAEETIRRFLH